MNSLFTCSPTCMAFREYPKVSCHEGTGVVHAKPITCKSFRRKLMLNFLMQVFDPEVCKYLSSLGIKTSWSLSEELDSQQSNKPQLNPFHVWITPNSKIYQTTIVLFWFVAIANTKTPTENCLAQFKELERSAVIDYSNVFLTDSIKLWLHDHCFLLARGVWSKVLISMWFFRFTCEEAQQDKRQNTEIDFTVEINGGKKAISTCLIDINVPLPMSLSHWGSNVQNGEKPCARVLIKEESVAEKVENTCFLGLCR